MTNLLQIIITLGRFAGVDEFSPSQKNQLIEERDDVAARLMDCENYGPIIVPGKGYQAAHNAQSIESIQT